MRGGEENVKGLLSTWGLAARPCDSCKTLSALLFCRSHSAFLCAACDANIHCADNRHQRVFACEVCKQSPACVTCKADSAALCASCDHDIHSANTLASRHQRLPVVPFFDTPSAAKAYSICSAFDDVIQTPPAYKPSTDNTDDADECNWPIFNQNGKPVGADFLSSDVNSFLDFESLDDFAALKLQIIEQLPSNQSCGADSVVPTQTKRINLEKYAGESCFEIDFSQSKLSPINRSAQYVSQSVSSSEVGVVPDGNSNSMSEVSNFPFHKSTNSDGCSAMSNGPQPSQLIGIDREARVMRYREKRKNRKFEKTIRYASRKAYAERRPRIKGRFAKRVGARSDAEQPYPAGLGGFTVEHGVVPLF